MQCIIAQEWNKNERFHCEMMIWDGKGNWANVCNWIEPNRTASVFVIWRWTMFFFLLLFVKFFAISAICEHRSLFAKMFPFKFEWNDCSLCTCRKNTHQHTYTCWFCSVLRCSSWHTSNGWVNRPNFELLFFFFGLSFFSLQTKPNHKPLFHGTHFQSFECKINV